ncbi:hypothetical protein Tco_1566733, partial [Tanacetum coccineum]
TMVRQAAMAFKLVLLMYHRNGRGHNFRRQSGPLIGSSIASIQKSAAP